MCGIFGFTKYLATPQQVIMASTLANEMVSRGRQSWGTTNGKEVSRAVGPITEADLSTTDLLYTSQGPFGLMLCHTRAASHGGVSESNAHPHTICSDDANTIVIGVHNGTLFETCMTEHNPKKYEVDTQLIYDYIANNKDPKDLKGTGVLVWAQDYTSVNFARFNSGNLYLAPILGATDEDIVGSLVWASTKAAVLKAAKLAGVTLGDEIAVDEFDVYTLTESATTKYHSISKTGRFEVGLPNHVTTFTDGTGATIIRSKGSYHSTGGRYVGSYGQTTTSSYFGGGGYQSTDSTCPRCKTFRLAGSTMGMCNYCARGLADADCPNWDGEFIFVGHHDGLGDTIEEARRYLASIEPSQTTTDSTNTANTSEESDQEGDYLDKIAANEANFFVNFVKV